MGKHSQSAEGKNIWAEFFFKFSNHILIHFFIFCSQQTSQIREVTYRDKPKLVELLDKEPYFPSGDQIFLVHLILCLLVYVLLKWYHIVQSNSSHTTTGGISEPNILTGR